MRLRAVSCPPTPGQEAAAGCAPAKQEPQTKKEQGQKQETPQGREGTGTRSQELRNTAGTMVTVCNWNRGEGHPGCEQTGRPCKITREKPNGKEYLRRDFHNY